MLGTVHNGAVTGIVDHIAGLPDPVVYLVIAALVFGEAAIFLGFVLPGETAVLLGGVLAAGGRLTLSTLLVLVVVAAIVGDSVGYEVGRRFGPRVLAWRPLRRHEARLGEARTYLRTRGGWAVMLGRWTAFLRAVMPGLAGASRMPYPRFLFFNAVGGAVWAVAIALLGYFAAASYGRVHAALGQIGALVLVAVVVVVVIVARRRRRAGQTGRPGSRPGP